MPQKVSLYALPGSMQYIILLWYLNRFLFVSYCTIIIDILRIIFHILYTKLYFLHHHHNHHQCGSIHRQNRHLRNTQCLFIYQTCKLLCVWLTVNLCLVNHICRNSHKVLYKTSDKSFVHKKLIIAKICILMYGHSYFWSCLYLKMTFHTDLCPEIP